MAQKKRNQIDFTGLNLKAKTGAREVINLRPNGAGLEPVFKKVLRFEDTSPGYRIIKTIVHKDLIIILKDNNQNGVVVVYNAAGSFVQSIDLPELCQDINAYGNLLNLYSDDETYTYIYQDGSYNTFNLNEYLESVDFEIAGWEYAYGMGYSAYDGVSPLSDDSFSSWSDDEKEWVKEKYYEHKGTLASEGYIKGSVVLAAAVELYDGSIVHITPLKLFLDNSCPVSYSGFQGKDQSLLEEIISVITNASSRDDVIPAKHYGTTFYRLAYNIKHSYVADLKNIISNICIVASRPYELYDIDGEWSKNNIGFRGGDSRVLRPTQKNINHKSLINNGAPMFVVKRYNYSDVLVDSPDELNDGGESGQHRTVSISLDPEGISQSPLFYTSSDMWDGVHKGSGHNTKLRPKIDGAYDKLDVDFNNVATMDTLIVSDTLLTKKSGDIFEYNQRYFMYNIKKKITNPKGFVYSNGKIPFKNSVTAVFYDETLTLYRPQSSDDESVKILSYPTNNIKTEYNTSYNFKKIILKGDIKNISYIRNYLHEVGNSFIISFDGTLGYSEGDLNWKRADTYKSSLVFSPTLFHLPTIYNSQSNDELKLVQNNRIALDGNLIQHPSIPISVLEFNSRDKPYFYEECKWYIENNGFNMIGFPLFLDHNDLINLFPDNYIPYTPYIIEPTSNIIEIKNQIAASEINNPLVFPEKLKNTITGAEIIGLSVANTEISESQFGQFPIYIFTSRGIFSAEVDQDAISKIVPLSTEICTNGDSIVSTEFGSVFSTAEGLKIIAGGQIKDLTDQLEEAVFVDSLFDDQNFKFVTGIIDEGSNAVLSSAGQHVQKTEILNFIQNSVIGYDQERKEIIVSNPDYSYSYVFNLRYNFIFSISEKFDEFVIDSKHPVARRGLHLYNTVTEGVTLNSDILYVSRVASDSFFKFERLKFSMNIKPEASTKFGIYIFGSVDNINWELVSAQQTSDQEIRDAYTSRLHMSLKYITIVLTGRIIQGSQLHYMLIDEIQRYSRKLR